MSVREGGRCPPSCGLPPGYFDKEEGQALIRRIEELPGARVLVAVAGAPGSGKSTLAEALVARLADAVVVPMDGFHLDDRILDGRGLRARKGAVNTFDSQGFAALAARLADGAQEVFYPVFDRSREISLAGAGAVLPQDRIVVVEGNYLLLDHAPWTAVSYDLRVFLDVPPAELRRRLTARWAGLGKSDAEIAAHLQNDLANAELVASQSRGADVVLVGQEAHHEPGDG
ncbi:AAA family ATPase [Paracoccus homiensis]|uniref:AAA family ATPase n=1 Tax=Paracoccus homiensis TaxID=364199 RepID=UPI00398CAC43